MIKVSIPMLGVTFLSQVNYVVDKSMASTFESGSLACLNYANLVSMLIFTVIGFVVSSYAYPIISKYHNDCEKVKEIFKQYFFTLLNLVIPVVILSIFYSNYISNLLYGRGRMIDSDIHKIAYILILYLPSSIAFCIKNLYSKLFYIKKNTNILLLIDLTGFVMNILLNIILANVIGVYGLALATSISTSISCLLLIFFAEKHDYTSFHLKEFTFLILLIMTTTIIGGVSYVIFEIFVLNSIFQFFYVSFIYVLSFVLFNFSSIRPFLINYLRQKLTKYSQILK